MRMSERNLQNSDNISVEIFSEVRSHTLVWIWWVPLLLHFTFLYVFHFCLCPILWTCHIDLRFLVDTLPISVYLRMFLSLVLTSNLIHLNRHIMSSIRNRVPFSKCHWTLTVSEISPRYIYLTSKDLRTWKRIRIPLLLMATILKLLLWWSL